jgi:hypothetical protein
MKGEKLIAKAIFTIKSLLAPTKNTRGRTVLAFSASSNQAGQDDNE